MDEDEPPQLTSSEPRPTDIGQTRSAELSPKLEIYSQDASIPDPPDEIHEDLRSPTHLSEEAVKTAASPISTPPVTGSEKIQEDDMPSLHTGIPDSCDESLAATVPDVAPPSPVNPGDTLAMPQTPKRPASRTGSQPNSRSPSPSLLSSPLTCLSSSPIREEETRQSTPESDFDVETTCEPTKTSAKRRSIGGIDIRAPKKSRVDTDSVDSVADTKVEEQPASGSRRKTGKKSVRSSPSPCPEPSLVTMNEITTSNASGSDPTDRGLMGIVVGALAMTRASSMDVESIRKIAVVCPILFPSPFHIALDLTTSPIGHSALVGDGVHKARAEANPLGDPRRRSKGWVL